MKDLFYLRVLNSFLLHHLATVFNYRAILNVFSALSDFSSILPGKTTRFPRMNYSHSKNKGNLLGHHRLVNPRLWTYTSKAQRMKLKTFCYLDSVNPTFLKLSRKPCLYCAAVKTLSSNRPTKAEPSLYGIRSCILKKLRDNWRTPSSTNREPQIPSLKTTRWLKRPSMS